MSWLENRILTGNLIYVVPTMTLFQNFEKLEIVLSTDIVNLASHDGTIMRTKVYQNLENASWLVQSIIENLPNVEPQKVQFFEGPNV